MKQNISSKTLLEIVGDSKDMDLSFITGKVNARRLERSKRNSTVTTDFTKECLNKYKIPFHDDTITNNKFVTNNKSETNSNQTNKYKSLFFAQMKDNEADLLFNADCEIIIPVKINDYTREIHNYMMKLPYEYFEDNQKIICNKLNITVTKGGSLMEFNYKFLLDYSSNMGLF